MYPNLDDSNFNEFKKCEKKYKLYMDRETDYSELLDFNKDDVFEKIEK
jgi:hypothetical protein